MLKLYGMDFSVPVIRVQFCINALDLEYEYVPVVPSKGDTKTESYLKMHPAGKVPVIDDDGVFVFESNVIMKYLCRKHGADLYPSDILTQATVDQWTDFVAHHLGANFTRVFFNKIASELFGMEKDPKSLETGHQFINRFLPIADQRLRGSTYLAGDSLSIADLCLLAILDPSEEMDIDVTVYPHINKWRQQLMAKPFYRKVHTSYGETLAATKKRLLGDSKN